MNKKLAKLIRDPACIDCKLYKEADEVCTIGSGPSNAEIMVVGKMPNSDNYQEALEADLTEAGIDPSKVFYTSAVKCKDWEANVGTTMVKACRKYLEAEIDAVKPKFILSLGNESLLSLTGHSGVMKYRGRVIDHDGSSVIPTVSPSAVLRNPGQRTAYAGDLKFFANQITGTGALLEKPTVIKIMTKKQLAAAVKLLDWADLVSFDVETYSTPPGDEFAADARMVSIAFTVEVPVEDDSGEVVDKVATFAIPLWHPESPFRQAWRSVLRLLGPALCKVPRRVAQNGKYDCRWLKHFGVPVDITYDTLLANHLLNENLLKGLKPQAMMRFGVEQWAVDTKELLVLPLTEVLEYNGYDTFYTYHLYLETKKELLDRQRLLRIFKLLMMPASNILVDVERRGVWLDREKLASHTKIGFDMRDEIERQIAEYLPPIESRADDEFMMEWHGTTWPADKKGKLREINWNPSIFFRWFVFDYLGMPILKRGKEKPDGSIGDPSVAEEIMLEFIGKHPAIDLMLERSKWQKYCSAFLSAYQELIGKDDRIHTTFKLYGTVTGRLSSGKMDADKVSSRKPVRGVNLQQVPRDDFIRGLFGSAPGYTFVEADFSQVELRVVAYLSRDRTMMHLYQTGQDIHKATAAWVLGIPEAQVSKDDRKKAKAVNFGFVYGMGAKKFVHTAFTKYQVVFSLEEAEQVRKTFFQNFTGLQPWHSRQRRLVAQHARVQSPLGRVRHLPDIRSGEYGVRGEAERQAINSPVQSFASDMTMLSMIELDRKFKRRGWDAHFISTVHDALLFEVRNDLVPTILPVIKRTMENLPLEKKFGVVLDVPIVADIKVGKYWGDAKELTEEEVYNYEPS